MCKCLWWSISYNGWLPLQFMVHRCTMATTLMAINWVTKHHKWPLVETLSFIVEHKHLLLRWYACFIHEFTVKPHYSTVVIVELLKHIFLCMNKLKHDCRDYHNTLLQYYRNANISFLLVSMPTWVGKPLTLLWYCNSWNITVIPVDQNPTPSVYALPLIANCCITLAIKKWLTHEHTADYISMWVISAFKWNGLYTSNHDT